LIQQTDFKGYLNSRGGEMTTITMRANGLIPFQIEVPVRSACQPLDVTLRDRGLWRLDGDHCWQVVICLQGSVWITQQNDFQDYLLGPGQGFIITRAGLVLIQARPDARIQITPSLEPDYCSRRVVNHFFA
jgi:hypothetical protein